MTEADDILTTARARSDQREGAYVPIDYVKANALFKKQKAALTRAVNSKDRDKVVLACKKAVEEWRQEGIPWPDSWSRWQNALDDVLPWNARVLLEDL